MYLFIFRIGTGRGSTGIARPLASPRLDPRSGNHPDAKQHQEGATERIDDVIATLDEAKRRFEAIQQNSGCDKRYAEAERIRQQQDRTLRRAAR